MAMGVLVERFMQEETAARDEFAEPLRGVRGHGAAPAGQGALRVSHVLATYNIKGGVGKTSAAVNLATLAAHDGARTLLWDLDPQGASTYLFRVKPKIKGGGAKLVRGKTDVEALIKGTDTEGLDLLPADFSYRHMDLALGDAKNRRTGSTACSRHSTASTTTCSWTARRASRSSRRASSRPPTRCSCRSSPRRSPRARSNNCTRCSRQAARGCSASSRWPTAASGCTAS